MLIVARKLQPLLGLVILKTEFHLRYQSYAPCILSIFTFFDFTSSFEI